MHWVLRTFGTAMIPIECVATGIGAEGIGVGGGEAGGSVEVDAFRYSFFVSSWMRHCTATCWTTVAGAWTTSVFVAVERVNFFSGVVVTIPMSRVTVDSVMQATLRCEWPPLASECNADAMEALLKLFRLRLGFD